VLARVPKGSTKMIVAAIRTIFAQPDDERVRQQLGVIAGTLVAGSRTWRRWARATRRRRDPGRDAGQDVKHDSAGTAQ